MWLKLHYSLHNKLLTRRVQSVSQKVLQVWECSKFIGKPFICKISFNSIRKRNTTQNNVKNKRNKVSLAVAHQYAMQHGEANSSVAGAPWPRPKLYHSHTCAAPTQSGSLVWDLLGAECVYCSKLRSAGGNHVVRQEPCPKGYTHLTYRKLARYVTARIAAQTIGRESVCNYQELRFDWMEEIWRYIQVQIIDAASLLAFHLSFVPISSWLQR